MSKSPAECKCLSCECGTYTYSESQICANCEDDKHATGKKRWSTMILASVPPTMPTEETM